MHACMMHQLSTMMGDSKGHLEAGERKLEKKLLAAQRTAERLRNRLTDAKILCEWKDKTNERLKQDVSAVACQCADLLGALKAERANRRANRRRVERAQYVARECAADATHAAEMLASGDARRQRADDRGAALGAQLNQCEAAIRQLLSSHTLERRRRERSEHERDVALAELASVRMELSTAQRAKRRVVEATASFITSSSRAVAAALRATSDSGKSRSEYWKKKPNGCSGAVSMCSAELDMSDCDLGDTGAAALADGLRRSLAPILRLHDAEQHQFYTPNGASSLNEHGNMQKESDLAYHLRHVLPLSVRLRSNNIGNVGAAALASALAETPFLISLDLRDNCIDDCGVVALLDGAAAQLATARRRSQLMAQAATSSNSSRDSAGTPPLGHLGLACSQGTAQMNSSPPPPLPSLRHLDLTDNAPIQGSKVVIRHWRARVGAKVANGFVPRFDGDAFDSSCDDGNDVAIGVEGGSASRNGLTGVATTIGTSLVRMRHRAKQRAGNRVRVRWQPLRALVETGGVVVTPMTPTSWLGAGAWGEHPWLLADAVAYSRYRGYTGIGAAAMALAARLQSRPFAAEAPAALQSLPLATGMQLRKDVVNPPFVSRPSEACTILLPRCLSQAAPAAARKAARAAQTVGGGGDNMQAAMRSEENCMTVELARTVIGMQRNIRDQHGPGASRAAQEPTVQEPTGVGFTRSQSFEQQLLECGAWHSSSKIIAEHGAHSPGRIRPFRTQHVHKCTRT